MLALDAALVPRHFRVRLVLTGGEVAEDQVVAMLDQDLPDFTSRLQGRAEQEYGAGVTVEAHPA